MSYKLEAFILSHRAAAALPDLRHLHRFPLNDQFALVPVTRQLYQEVVATYGRAEHDPYDMFYRLDPRLAETAVRASSVSPVLYVEVDVVNGIGDRTAVVWHEGRAAFGPSEGRSDVTEAMRVFGRLAGLSLEQVGELDIFRHRFTEDWVRHLEDGGEVAERR